MRSVVEGGLRRLIPRLDPKNRVGVLGGWSEDPDDHDLVNATVWTGVGEDESKKLMVTAYEFRKGCVTSFRPVLWGFWGDKIRQVRPEEFEEFGLSEEFVGMVLQARVNNLAQVKTE